jgi:KUP system potassium uptake protein
MKELRWREKRHDAVSESGERAQFHASRGDVATLAIGALGVVFGDIGTSPHYAIDQIFFGSADIGRTPENILGAITLAIWTITVVVAIKYALLLSLH